MISFNEVAPPKIPNPIFFTFFGILIDSKLSQNENASCSIELTLKGILIFF